MKILGFAICCSASRYFTKGKIYPYFEINGPFGDGDYDIRIKDDKGRVETWAMFWELQTKNRQNFGFYHYPEFPENVSEWTEDDWFQYDLKYGS